jgi:putative ABC transport system permease protein
MTLVSIAARNALRNKFRTILTVLGGAVAVLAFILLRTVLYAWNVGVEYAAKDRLATRHKVSIVIPLPKRYVDDIKANVPGIKIAAYANWFGAKWPKDPNEFFGNMAVSDDIFDVFPEMRLDPAQRQAYEQDRKGAIIGDVLAKKLGLHVGDKAVLAGTIYPGDWEFTIDGIYTAPSQSSVDRSSFYFHWKYLNESIPESQRDKVGWIMSRIDDPSKSAETSAAIDRLFDDRDMQTATMSERAMNNGFLGALSAVLVALDIVSIIILAIMMLILGNTIAMGVRERTTEYGVLRALGFQPGHIRLFIVGEAVTVALLSALVGLGLSYPIVQLGMGRWLEENMGAFFPYFRINPLTMVVALTLTVALGAIASLVPAVRAGRLVVTDALRRIA